MNQRKWKGLVCSSTCLFLPLAILPQVNEDGEIVTIASWYGPGFHGKKTASGERFNQNALTAASRTLPFGTKVKVRNPKNGKTCTVTINDRGPFVKGRGIDLSHAAAQRLGIDGIAKVCYSTVPKFEPKPAINRDEREETPKAPDVSEIEIVAATGVTESVEKPMAAAAVQPSAAAIAQPTSTAISQPPARVEAVQEPEPFGKQIESLRSQLKPQEARDPQLAILRASQFIEAPQFNDLVPAAQNGQLRPPATLRKSTVRAIRTHSSIAKPVAKSVAKTAAKAVAKRAAKAVAKPAAKAVAKPVAKAVARPAAIAKPLSKAVAKNVAKTAPVKVAKKKTARTVAYSRGARKYSRAKKGTYIAHRRYKSKFGRSMDKLTARASHLYKELKGIFAML